jgi:hypothetical protein
MGSAPAPFGKRQLKVPGGPTAIRPPEYYGSAARRVITETSQIIERR